MTTINFRFEHCKQNADNDTQLAIVKNMKLGNLLDVPIARLSQVTEMMIDFSPNVSVTSLDNGPEPYIFATALCYSPPEWTDTERKKSIFEYLPPKVIQDLRNKKALLLLDQSVEGYGAEWLWAWFHRKCTEYQIPPQSIIYITGDQTAPEDYNQWCRTNVTDKIVVIPSTILFHYVKRHTDRYRVSTSFDKMLSHKTSNPPKYLFDCFMLRPRPHRVLNYLHLVDSGLLEYGNIGMQNIFEWKNLSRFCTENTLTNYKLPKDIVDRLNCTSTARKIEHTNKQDNLNYSDYAERILTSMYENSWVTQVVETTFFNYETAFVSEKSIKPISYMQPFVTIGSRHTLKYLRNLGFKTFHPVIDESYDEEKDDGERFKKVMAELNRIKDNPDKISWLKSLEPILTHNYNLFQSLDFNKSLEYSIINKHYTEYFKEFNVS